LYLKGPGVNLTPEPAADIAAAETLELLLLQVSACLTQHVSNSCTRHQSSCLPVLTPLQVGLHATVAGNYCISC
jgi:hypothetical protein